MAGHAQSVHPFIHLNTFIDGRVNAPVSRPDGSPAGAGFTAELVILSGGHATLLTPATTFRTTSYLDQFYVVPVDVPIPGGVPGEQITVALRVYDTVATSYVVAINTPTLHRESNPVTVVLRDPSEGGVELIGLQGFVLGIPEPSVIALAGLGVSALLLCSRKGSQFGRRLFRTYR